MAQPQVGMIIPGAPVPAGKWDLGLCEQTKDCGNCCKVFCCMFLGFQPCLIGNIAESLGHDWCLGCCVLGGTGLFFYRLEIMKARNIPFTPCCCCKGECAEFWRIFFCQPCVLCQTQHELNLMQQAAMASAPAAQAIVR